MEALIQPRVLTEEEKQRLRKERFNSGENVTTVEAQRILEDEKRKILERQKKFGVISQLPGDEEEKKRQRMARFGLTLNSRESQMNLTEDDEKKKKRAERFGIKDDSDALQKRAERFKNELDSNSQQISQKGQGKRKFNRFNRFRQPKFLRRAKNIKKLKRKNSFGGGKKANKKFSTRIRINRRDRIPRRRVRVRKNFRGRRD